MDRDSNVHYAFGWRIEITLTQFIEHCFSSPNTHCQWIEDRAKQITNHAMVKTIWNIRT